MNDTELRATRVLAEAFAKEAGALALSGFRANTTIELKGEIDLVTRFDRECEALIRARISSAFPSHRIVGEEGEPQGEGELVWYVDPIDGTTNYAHGLPFFCVSIALYRGSLPLVAAVCAPALGATWSAHAGGGTTRDGVPCAIRKTEQLRDALLATGFAYDRFSALDDNLVEHDRFVKLTRGVRRCGAAALDLAFVADGTFDGYWEQNLRSWDIAAGMLLVVESGGEVCDYVGDETTPESGQVLAGSRELLPEIRRVLGEVRAERGLSAGGLRRDRPGVDKA